MDGFDSETDRRDAIRKQIVDTAYDEILKILSAHGATHTPQERAYLQAAILKRLVQAMYLDLQMAVYREEIKTAESKLEG